MHSRRTSAQQQAPRLTWDHLAAGTGGQVRSEGCPPDGQTRTHAARVVLRHQPGPSDPGRCGRCGDKWLQADIDLPEGCGPRRASWQALGVAGLVTEGLRRVLCLASRPEAA